jgi:hypothetical protein
MKNTVTIQVKKTTIENVEVNFPIYVTDSTTICAIYSNDCNYTATTNSMSHGTLDAKFWLGLLPKMTTREAFLDQCKIAMKNQQQLFTEITWRESMEQNPAMADMTIKDYSLDQLEEMNYDVRDADESERMERNAEIED